MELKKNWVHLVSDWMWLWHPRKWGRRIMPPCAICIIKWMVLDGINLGISIATWSTVIIGVELLLSIHMCRRLILMVGEWEGIYLLPYCLFPLWNNSIWAIILWIGMCRTWLIPLPSMLLNRLSRAWYWMLTGWGEIFLFWQMRFPAWKH